MSLTHIHRSFLVWRDALYAKIAGVVIVVSVGLYWVHRPVGLPNGGSLLGYSFGTLALGLIIWLAWYGVRRRRYGKGLPLTEWLSAHVYLGLTLVVVATLHTGFQFHRNVHTVAYGLMILVVGSGIFGVFGFWRYPTLMTSNRSGASLDKMANEAAVLDARCRLLALAFDDELRDLVLKATEDIGGGFGIREFVFGRRPDLLAGPTGAAIAGLRDAVGGARRITPGEVLPLVQLLTQRATLLLKFRRDRRYRALLLLWRVVHVPMTFALLVALVAHVFSVFYYR